MKKITIGYIYNESGYGEDEEFFLKEAKKKNVNVIMFNSSKDLNEKKLEENAKKCDIFFNNSAEEFSLEVVKTIEGLGKKFIDPSSRIYYSEDKWMFFFKCKKHHIPTADTILLSEHLGSAKKELREFNHWPVILKRIQGSNGQFVARAEDLKDAEKIITGFWEKGNEKLPIIAQELIDSPCYRVLTIGSKVAQTIIKESRTWKAMYVPLSDKKVPRFKVDKELKEIIKKIVKAFQIKICGIDLFKKDSKWIVCEINTSPGFDFVENEREKIIGEVVAYLKKEAKKR